MWRSGEHSPDAVGDHRGPTRHVEPGESQHPIAGDGQAAITVSVGLKGAAGAVSGATVDLHDQSRFGPEEVHDVVDQRNVHIRLGKAVTATEGEESLLEVVACGGRPGAMLVEQGTESTGARATEVSSHDLVQVVFIADVQSLGLVDGPLELPVGQDGRQVEDGARRGGDRNPAMKSALSRMKG